MNIKEQRVAAYSISPEMLPKDLAKKYLWLKYIFLKNAEVKSRASGFISAPFMNKDGQIDLKALTIQADIISYFFRSLQPSRIIGIPQSGIPLAREVTTRFPKSIYIDSVKPSGLTNTSDWPNAVDFSVLSFTRGVRMPMRIAVIEPNETYLVIDDVSAYGNAGIDFIHTIQERGGIVVGLGVGFAKQFQGGIQRVVNECGINVVSVITVKDISPENKVILV